MEQAKKEVTDALAILSTLAVSGDVVDVMAAVRTKLKRAISLMEENKDG
mgnify:CR=1 FL=1|jgi:hypothetical protein